MTARFAGSLDDRRRRRLAAESDNTETARAPRARTSRSANARAAQERRTRRATHFPLRKLISSRLWKIWGTGLLVLLSGAAVVACTWLATERPEKLGPGLVRFFDSASSRVVPCFDAVLLMLSGQLATLIWWVRSRSLHDFNAQYRVWAWKAATDFLLAGCLLTGAHLAWSETVAWLWLVDFPNKEIWFWMGPACVLGIVLFQLLHREMRECRSSLFLLWLAGISFAFLGAWQFGELPRWVASRISAPEGLVETGVLAAACFLLFQAMLVHARHVIYKSVEAPEKRVSRLGAVMSKLGFSRLTLRRRKPALDGKDRSARRMRRKRKITRGTARESSQTSDASRESASRDEETVSATGARNERTVESRGKSGSETPATGQPSQANRSGITSTPNRPISSSPNSSPSPARSVSQQADASQRASSVGVRVERPVENDALRGLSKKERRLLKQQRRDELRNAQHG